MIKFKRLNENTIIPTKGTIGSAGFDLYYPGPDIVVLHQGFIMKFDLGFATEFDLGLVALIRDRSSMGKRGVKVFGGVIDSDYRGEWAVILGNLGPHIVSISPGFRIAQVLFMPVYIKEHWIETNSLNDSERGVKGYGSTGQ